MFALLRRLFRVRQFFAKLFEFPGPGRCRLCGEAVPNQETVCLSCYRDSVW